MWIIPVLKDSTQFQRTEMNDKQIFRIVGKVADTKKEGVVTLLFDESPYFLDFPEVLLSASSDQRVTYTIYSRGAIVGVGIVVCEAFMYFVLGWRM